MSSAGLSFSLFFSANFRQQNIRTYMFAKNTGVLTQFRPPNGPNSHTCSPQPALHPSSTSIHIRKVCHPPQPHRPTGLDALPLARLHHPPARRAALAALQDGHQGGCLQGAALQASLPGQRSAARTSSVCFARDGWRIEGASGEKHVGAGLTSIE